MLRDFPPLPFAMLRTGTGYAQPTQVVPEKVTLEDRGGERHDRSHPRDRGHHPARRYRGRGAPAHDPARGPSAARRRPGPQGAGSHHGHRYPRRKAGAVRFRARVAPRGSAGARHHDAAGTARRCSAWRIVRTRQSRSCRRHAQEGRAPACHCGGQRPQGPAGGAGGCFSATQIARQLGVSIQTSEIARTFSEIEATLAR